MIFKLNLVWLIHLIPAQEYLTLNNVLSEPNQT